MKRKFVPLVGAAALLAGIPLIAAAHTHVFLGINLGGLFGPPVVYAAPPVVYAPPPVVYAPPPVVYVPRVPYRYYTRPVYYGPGAYYGGTIYIGNGGWRHRDHWDRDDWHDHHWDRRYWHRGHWDRGDDGD